MSGASDEKSQMHTFADDTSQYYQLSVKTRAIEDAVFSNLNTTDLAAETIYLK